MNLEGNARKSTAFALIEALAVNRLPQDDYGCRRHGGRANYVFADDHAGTDNAWKVWLKTSGQKCDCNGPQNNGDYYFWTSASLSKGGHQIVSLGTPNCILNYPFYLAREFYK